MKMRTKKLAEIADIIAGQSPSSIYYNKNRLGLPFYQGKSDFGDKYPSANNWCNGTKNKQALPNDILMSVRAPVGPVNISQENSIIGRGLSAIRVKEGYSFEYVYYYLKSHEAQISKLGTGSTFKAITQDTISKIGIHIPEKLEDQIRIAEILTKAETLIAKRKESINTLDELLKSTFLDMFGDPVRNTKKWELKRIDEFSDTRLGKMRDKQFITGDYLKYYLGNSNVRWFSFDLNSLEQMDFNEEEQEKFSLKYGDLLVCEGGEIGRCAIWKSEKQDVYFQKAIHRVRVDESIIKQVYLQYVFYWYATGNGFKNVTSKATISHLTGEKLKETKIPVPPLSLQNQFRKKAAKLESIKNNYQKSLSDLENLYTSLSQRAFTTSF